jgi:hypothetical protein
VAETSPETISARFIALGDVDRRIVSEDYGGTWKWNTKGEDEDSILYNLAFGDELFVAVGGDIDEGRIMTTANGEAWTDSVSGTGVLCDVAYGGSLYVTVGLAGVQLWSDDAVTWHDIEPAVTKDYKSVAYGNDLFVAVGLFGAARVVDISDGDDALEWTDSKDSFAQSMVNVAYGSEDDANNAFFVAVGEQGLIATTEDGLTWERTLDKGSDLYGVAYGLGRWVVVGTGRTFVREDSGWVEHEQSWSFNKVAWGDGVFIATTEEGALLSSSDGEDWNEIAIKDNPQLVGIGFGGG